MSIFSRVLMMGYNHLATFGLLGEILPWEDNRVELAEEVDQHTLPVARVAFNLHDNDKKHSARNPVRSLASWRLRAWNAAGEIERTRSEDRARRFGGERQQRLNDDKDGMAWVAGRVGETRTNASTCHS